MIQQSVQWIDIYQRIEEHFLDLSRYDHQCRKLKKKGVLILIYIFLTFKVI